MPQFQKRHSISGGDLVAALLTTVVAVKVVRLGLPVTKLPSRLALALVMRQPDRFDGKARGSRVLFIREFDPRPAVAPDTHHWDDRSCRHFDNPVNSGTVRLWDRILGVTSSLDAQELVPCLDSEGQG